MAAAAQLTGVTAGAVPAIADHADAMGMLQPVLQVVDMRMFNVKNPSVERFRVELSDGVYSLTAMLATAENLRAREHSIRNGSIIRLREFTCSTIGNRKIIIVARLDVLQREHDIIGNSKPFDMRNAHKGQRSGTTSVNQGMLAEIPWEMVSEITNVVGYLAKPVLFTVKATLSVVNIESLCYAACPLVVNGNQCDGAVSINGYEWWNCDGCNMTFAACDYRYKLFVQLMDSTGGEIYATTTQEVGEEIFGQTARELYVMKYEKQDHARYNKIIMGAQNWEYLFDIKLNREAFSDESETLPMFTIVKAESLYPSVGNHPPVRRTSVGMRTGFTDSEALLRQRLQNLPHVLSEEEADSNSL